MKDKIHVEIIHQPGLLLSGKCRRDKVMAYSVLMEVRGTSCIQEKSIVNVQTTSITFARGTGYDGATCHEMHFVVSCNCSD